MHPFLVWLLCARHESPGVARLSAFAERKPLFLHLNGNEDLCALLRLALGWVAEYNTRGSLLVEDFTAAWVEYQTWLAATLVARNT